MAEVAQSPFLQALGFAIFNSLWQFGLLWLICLLASSTNIASAKKYVTALTLQLVGFVWFIGTFTFYYKECLEAAEVITNLPGGYALSRDGFISSGFMAFALKGEQVLPYLSLAYLLLLAGLLLKTIRCYRSLHRLRNSSLTKISGQWRVFVQQLSLQLGIKKPVAIYLSATVEGPVTLGFFKPLILLPLSMINQLSHKEMEAVLVHELAHIKRNDYFINLLLSVVETLLFFNPFMQLMSKNIKRERENSCDDWVLQYQYSATTYARALLTIAKSSVNANRLAMHATEDSRALLARVKRMIEKKETSTTYRHQIVALISTTGLLSWGAWLVPGHTISGKLAGILEQKILLVEPLTAKVENPLFNPVFFLAKEQYKENEQKATSSTITAPAIATTVSTATALKKQKSSSRVSPEFVPNPPHAAEAPLPPDTDSFPLSTITSLDWRKQQGNIEKARRDVESFAWRDFLPIQLEKAHHLTREQFNTQHQRKQPLQLQLNMLAKAKKTLLEKSIDRKTAPRIAIIIDLQSANGQQTELEELGIVHANLPENIELSIDASDVAYKYSTPYELQEELLEFDSVRREIIIRKHLEEWQKTEAEAAKTEQQSSGKAAPARKLKSIRL